MEKVMMKPSDLQIGDKTEWYEVIGKPVVTDDGVTARVRYDDDGGVADRQWVRDDASVPVINRLKKEMYLAIGDDCTGRKNVMLLIAYTKDHAADLYDRYAGGEGSVGLERVDVIVQDDRLCGVVGRWLV